MKLAALVVVSIALASVISLPFRSRSERESAQYISATQTWSGKVQALAAHRERAGDRRLRLPTPPAPPMRTFYLGYLASAVGAMLPWGVYFALGRRRRSAKVTFGRSAAVTEAV